MQLPTHAYLPGQNERHSEDAFEAIRASAVPGQNAVELARCEAFLTGLHFLANGFFWESHEVFEPVWMALPEGSEEKRFVQGLIQLANGRLKLLMGRPKAALRLVGLARSLVPTDASQIIMMISVQDVHCWIDALESEIQLLGDIP